MHVRFATLVALLAATAASSASAQAGRTTLLNPNLATEDELLTVPGLDADAVAAIVAARPILRASELNAIVAEHGVSDAQATYGALWLPIDLNDASEDEILLIPGVGDRMLHEFEEYRPYVSLAQFRREIGKYVDDDELDRLSQYVYVRIDLNSASEEDILSLPGVGRRMAHEFEEYRPYEAMAQFAREIGKYVDEGEVRRLSRYVEIR